MVLKDEADIDPNDQNSMLEHLDKVVNFFLPNVSFLHWQEISSYFYHSLAAYGSYSAVCTIFSDKYELNMFRFLGQKYDWQV